MKIRAIIVDDEPMARSEMRYLLDRVGKVEVLGEASTAEEAYKLMESICYDLAFIDINMPGMSGIELTEKMQTLSCQPAVIFTTAYSQFAVKAFELDVVDYLVKPVSEERLQNAIVKVRKRLKNWQEKTTTTPQIDRIPLSKNGKTYLLCPPEIFYIESHGEFTIIHSQKGKFMSSVRLKDFEARLQKHAFFRAHRSYVVNLDYVTEMVPLYGGLYSLKLKDPNHSEIPVSRRQSRQLKSLISLK